MSRRVASVTFIYNHEPFIIPHFTMLSNLDHNFAFVGDKPLQGYDSEHGTSAVKDRSEELIREKFPHVEIVHHSYDGVFCSELYNAVSHIFENYDIVLRLDPDMFFTDSDWSRLINFIREGNQDSYYVNYPKCSINYYMDFDHGLQDAMECDLIGYDPKKKLTGILDYPSEKPYVINWNNFMIHHFRGWNKPKSVTPNWPNEDYGRMAFFNYSNDGDWFHCPQEIRDKFDKETADKWLQIFNT